MHPNDGRVVSNFIMQALQGADITLYGDGGQTRSFCYVDDMVDGILRFMDTPSGENGAPGFPGSINLGNPDEFTIGELAEKIMELTNSGSRLVFRPLPTDDPIRRRPDISRAQEHLGWEPKVGLEEGLRRTIEYFERVLFDYA